MNIVTLDEMIGTEVKRWMEFLANTKNENEPFLPTGYERWLPVAHSIEALPEKTPEAVNVILAAHYESRVLLVCTECGKEMRQVVSFDLGDDSIELCPDCLRAALAMFDQGDK
jgi:hypothetical protein